LKYYKDQKQYKGKITLAKTSKVLKTAKNQFEIPMGDKTYIFVEVDKKEQQEYTADPDGESELFTNDIDKWIETIEEVINNL
jgi:hypothetical protein